jgi:hypothetical protein
MANDFLETFAKCIAPQPSLNISALARCYGFSRQNFHYLAKHNGITISEFESPHWLFETLCATGRESPLRRLLSDPADRQTIINKILTAEQNAHSKYCRNISRQG